jgi:hypothetical protein
LLASELKLRFAPEDVFLDTHDVALVGEWLEDTLQRARTSDVFLVLMGPQWAAAADERTRRRRFDRGDEDIVRMELEAALTHGVTVIPVLIDTTMPARASLARPFQVLADLQAHELRHTRWDDDVEALARKLSDAPPLTSPRRGPRFRSQARRPFSHPGTDAGRVACYLAEGTVVGVLGSGVNAADSQAPWEPAEWRLPDSAELARHLARAFRLRSDSRDLAQICEHVLATEEGRADLHRELRRLLCTADPPPSSVHRFLAGIPGPLRAAGSERHQLLITANLDTALERAFDEVHEPYDLVIFMAAGEHRGRFVHLPWSGGDGARPRSITVPNEYVDLPIDEEGELERTVIVKLHGGAADLGPEWPLRDNFVVTEDDYIGYLTQSPVEGLIPLQVLDKIRDSHFLFLGYRLRDWSVRVFLQRVWGDRPLDALSWSVDPGHDDVERWLWKQRNVHVVPQSIAGFLAELGDEIGHELARLTADTAER